MAYYNAFQSLQRLGVLDVILPFILVFTIIFAVLQKVKIFGKDSKKYNVVVALVMGLGVVFPHVLYGQECLPDMPARLGRVVDPVCVINNSLPSVSVIAVAIIMMLLLIGVFGKEYDIGQSSIGGFVAFGAFAVVVWIFGSKAGWWSFPTWLAFLVNDPEIMTLIITILVFGIIVWMITSEKDEGDKPNKFFDEFKKGLK